MIDFGLAKFADRSNLTQESTTLGTVACMSPEQARGAKVDHRSDIWSVGVVLYQMVTGKLPFNSDYEQTLIYSILSWFGPRREKLTPIDAHLFEWLEATLRRDYPAALEACGLAVGLSPDASWLLQLACNAVSSNRPGVAIEVLEGIGPTTPQAGESCPFWNVKLTALHMLGKYEEELAAARRGDREVVLRISDKLAGMDDPYRFGMHTRQRASIAALLGEKGNAVNLLRDALAQGVRYNDPHPDMNMEVLFDYPPCLELLIPEE